MLLFFGRGTVYWSLVTFWTVKNLTELADGPTRMWQGWDIYFICHCDSFLALWLNVLLARN